MSDTNSTLTTKRASRTRVQTIEVSGIPEEILRRLDERARERGSDRETVIRDLITRELGGDGSDLARKRFDAAAAPIRAGFAESGLTEEAAEALLDEGLRAIRADRRRARLKPLVETAAKTDER